MEFRGLALIDVLLSGCMRRAGDGSFRGRLEDWPYWCLAELAELEGQVMEASNGGLRTGPDRRLAQLAGREGQVIEVSKGD